MRRGRPLLDDVLGGLPRGWHAVGFGQHRAVVGPTGIFAVDEGGIDVDDAGKRVAHVASELRDVLARELSWAPFVHPLVVVEIVVDRSEAATVVPRRMLHDVLTEGHQQLTPEQIGRIVAVLRRARRGVIA